MKEKKDFTIELLLDGKKMGMNPYVRSIFYSVITAMVSTLKNAGNPEKIVITISRG